MLRRTRSFLQRLTGTSGEDRRLWERHSTQRDARIRVGPEDGGVITAQIQDVSRGGIRLLAEAAVPNGTMVRIDLPPLDRVPRTTVLACVVHVRPTADGRFALGGNFSTELSDSDLQALGAQRVKPKEGDQRYWERVPAAGQAQYSRLNPAGETQAAEIHNLSPTGVALRASEEIDPGTLLNIELRDQAGQPIVNIVACVVYLTTLEDGLWLAGCNFIRELYDEDLHALIAHSA